MVDINKVVLVNVVLVETVDDKVHAMLVENMHVISVTLVVVAIVHV